MGSVRVDLEGGLREMFEAVKKDRGLKQNTEVVRQLITEEYKRIQKRQGDEAFYGKRK